MDASTKPLKLAMFANSPSSLALRNTTDELSKVQQVSYVAATYDEDHCFLEQFYNVFYADQGLKTLIDGNEFLQGDFCSTHHGAGRTEERTTSPVLEPACIYTILFLRCTELSELC